MKLAAIENLLARRETAALVTIGGTLESVPTNPDVIVHTWLRFIEPVTSARPLSGGS